MLEINPGDDVLKKLSNNIESIMGWCPSEEKTFDNNNPYHRIAKQSLVSAVIILDVIGYFKQNITDVDIAEVFKGGHVVIEDDGELVKSLKSSLTPFQRYSSHYKDEKKALYKAMGEAKGVALNEHQIEAMFNTSTPDYSLRAQFVFHEAVFGIFERENKVYSWFQLEAHSHEAVEKYGNTCLDLIDGVIQFSSHHLGQLLHQGKSFDYSLEKLGHHIDFLKYTFFGKSVNIGPYGNSPKDEKHPIMLSNV
jgi:hypothetical protein